MWRRGAGWENVNVTDFATWHAVCPFTIYYFLCMFFVAYVHFLALSYSPCPKTKKRGAVASIHYRCGTKAADAIAEFNVIASQFFLPSTLLLDISIHKYIIIMFRFIFHDCAAFAVAHVRARLVVFFIHFANHFYLPHTRIDREECDRSRQYHSWWCTKTGTSFPFPTSAFVAISFLPIHSFFGIMVIVCNWLSKVSRTCCRHRSPFVRHFIWII